MCTHSQFLKAISGGFNQSTTACIDAFAYQFRLCVLKTTLKSKRIRHKEFAFISNSCALRMVEQCSLCIFNISAAFASRIAFLHQTYFNRTFCLALYILPNILPFVNNCVCKLKLCQFKTG